MSTNDPQEPYVSLNDAFATGEGIARARLTAAIEAKQAAGAGLAVRSITLTGTAARPGR